MKKGLVFLTLFIICLLGVMIVAPGFIDWNRHKPTIIAQLENATGHDYEINGPLEFTILPFPKLLIEGLEISNEDTRLLTLKRLDVQVELMPLIQGNINIQSVSLIDPVIKLAVNKDGEQSWMTPKLNDMMSGKEDASAADEQKNVSELITLGGISIENGLLEYSDARNGTKEIIQNVDLDLTAATLSGPFEVDGSLTARNQNIDLNLKTGRMEKGADTLSVSAAISLPEMNSTVDYSGVVGLNGGADLQGEASVKTPDLNRLLKAFEIADVSYLSKPFETAGIFSYADNVAAYRNLSMSLDGQAANGSLSFAQAQGGSPAILDVSLAATKKVSLDRLLPRKNAKTADKAAVSFLPQSITLPMNIDASIDLGASQLEYNKSSFSDVAAKISKSGKDVTVNASAKAMQKDTVAVEAKIGFGSVSVSENSGSVTYSDPAMNYKASVESTSAQAFAAFITPEQVNTLKPYLSKGLRSSLAGSVQPTKASITAGTASLNETNLNFSGSYGVKASPSGRDVVSVNLETENINLDQWIVSSEKAGPKGKINISDYTKMLDLPFNLSVTALSKRVSFGDAAYQNLQLKAATAGQKLTIDNFSITDSDSNNMLVAGTIDDVVALRDISMSVSGKTNDLEALLKNFDVDTSGFPARVGPAELVSEFRGQSDDLAFTANVKALRGTAEASGTLANMLNTPEVSGLTLRLRHPSYVELARLFKPNFESGVGLKKSCLLYTSPSPRDVEESRMPSSA